MHLPRLEHVWTLRASRSSGGFTLIEAIIALAVVSVGVGIFMQLFGAAIALGRTSQDRQIGARAAEGQMALLLGQPERFLWNFTPETGDQPFAILQGEEDPKAGVPVELPLARPADEGADRRVESAFHGFRWQAFGRFPKGKNHCEVTVVVRWEEAGRPQSLALTSALPGFRVGGLR